MRVNPKVGMQKIRIFQLDRELGLKEWTYKQDLRNEEYEAFELYTESKDINTTDIAICISATHDIFEDVKEYLIKDDIKVNKIINFHLKSKYVINGNHACNLVSQISETISKERFVNIHIFVSAPISMMYMLGKNSFDVKNINLYEHFGESSYKKVAFIQKTS